ncbi:MAG: hypothetical protein SGPRY_005816 [Prymnesium sp.]
MPPYAITMMVPLLNLSVDHGPTILHTHGVFPESHQVDADFASKAYQQIMKDKCDESSGLREVQFVLEFGDAVLFDYQTLHKGCRNRSPQSRSMLYLTFSRPWYTDEGFDDIDGDSSRTNEGHKRQRSAAAMAIIGSSAGTALSELGHAQRKDFLRVSRPTRYAVPFAQPNTSFTESYRKQTVAEGAKRELETLAGHGFLFPSWIDFDLESDFDAAVEDTAKSRARPPKTCSAASVFTEPYSEQDFW